MSGSCAVPNCERDAKTGQLMCLAHWRRLPKPIRDAVWETWAEVKRNPHAYREARAAAINYHRDDPGDKQGSLI